MGLKVLEKRFFSYEKRFFMRKKLTPGRVEVICVNLVVFRPVDFHGRFYFFLYDYSALFGKSSPRGYYLQMSSDELYVPRMPARGMRKLIGFSISVFFCFFLFFFVFFCLFSFFFAFFLFFSVFFRTKNVIGDSRSFFERPGK